MSLLLLHIAASMFTLLSAVVAYLVLLLLSRNRKRIIARRATNKRANLTHSQFSHASSTHRRWVVFGSINEALFASVASSIDRSAFRAQSVAFFIADSPDIKWHLTPKHTHTHIHTCPVAAREAELCALGMCNATTTTSKHR